MESPVRLMDCGSESVNQPIILQSHSRTLSNANYTVSKINLVDLAGSERLGKTGVSRRLSVCIIIYGCMQRYCWNYTQCNALKCKVGPGGSRSSPINVCGMRVVAAGTSVWTVCRKNEKILFPSRVLKPFLSMCS